MTNETQTEQGLQKGAADRKSAFPRLLKEPEAQQYLALSRRTLGRLVADGRLRRVKIGRSVRYDLRDLDRFIEEHAE